MFSTTDFFHTSEDLKGISHTGHILLNNTLKTPYFYQVILKFSWGNRGANLTCSAFGSKY
jgi:hypothetical protein